MSDPTVKNCNDFLRIVLTKLIKIATYRDMRIMLDEVLRLIFFVNLINDTSIRLGTIFTILYHEGSQNTFLEL